MNWYYEKDGVSQGPLPEPEMLALVRKQQVHAHSLVWHPGLEEWDSVQKLKPDWLTEPKVEAVKQPQAKQTVPKTDGPLPSQEPAVVGKLAKPKAGLEKSEDGKKPGLLGRLFGFGKKK